jgi:hypothetical protein
MERHKPDKILELTDLAPCETAVIRLPHGRLMALEWLEGKNYSIKVLGFESIEKYHADEEYRLAGFEPLLRNVYGYIPMQDSC